MLVLLLQLSVRRLESLEVISFLRTTPLSVQAVLYQRVFAPGHKLAHQLEVGWVDLIDHDCEHADAQLSRLQLAFVRRLGLGLV